jgi:hypothetical protein
MVSTSAVKAVHHTEVSAALSPSGELVLAYIANRPRQTNTLGLAVLSANGELEHEANFEGLGDTHYDPWLVAGDAGLRLVWLGFSGGRAPERDMYVGLSESADGRSWSAPQRVHAPDDCPQGPTACLDKPMLSAGAARHASPYLLYFANQLDALRALPLAGDSAPQSISTGAFADAVVDADGRLHVISIEVDNEGASLFGDRAYHVSYRSLSAEHVLSEPVRVSLGDQAVPFFFSSPRIRVAADGTLFAAYPAGERQGWAIWLAVSTDGGASWKHHRVSDDNCATHMLPAMDLGGDDNPHLVWLENRTGQGLVAYRKCDAHGSCGAVERVSDAPFASFSFARHDSRWLGDYISLVVDRQRGRVHVVWAQPILEEGVPTTRIHHAVR